MAVVSGTTKTYEQVGIREDLSDMIYDITPIETPFVSMCRKGPKAGNTYFEWQIDAIRAANGNNAVLEGDDASYTTIAATTRPRNYVQLMDEAVIVSDAANAVNTAGRKRELAYQVAKSAKAIKLDMETRATGNYASDNGSAATARQTAGVEAWLTTNVSRGSGGADGGYTTTGIVVAATDATVQRTFTEALLKAQILSTWNAGGNPKIILVGGFNKQQASGFSGIATQYQDFGNVKSAKSIAILGAADWYVSDYGTHHIVPDRYSRDRTALILDMEYWEIRHLQPFNVTPLARTGHAEKRLLKVEWGVCSKNEGASGAVADLTTS